MTQEALKLALEALEVLGWQPTEEAMDYRDNAITAIKEALAQPDPYKQGYTDAMNWKVQNHLEHLPTAQPEQEPVAWMYVNTDGECEQIEYGKPYDDPSVTPLYTTPPQRKPLTDEEIDKLPWGPHEGNPMTFAEGLRDFARAIEAAHGIKENT